jgi:AsmA-like protein
MAGNEARENGTQSRPARVQGSAGIRPLSLTDRMDRKSILTKTAKGLMEATGKTSDLPRDLRNLLKEVDGKVTVGQLQMRQELFTETKFMDALRSLERDGYVREMTPQKDDPAAPRSPLSRPSGPGSDGAAGEDLDFTAIAARTGSKQASDISRQIASERDRVEAAAKAKAEAEARARREAEEQAKKLSYDSEAKKEREEMDRIHREAEERSRKAAEEKARREAEEKAKRDAEARAKREAEERVRREAEDKARREAEEKARREAEERARREAAERARREAEERAKREAEERARREAEERAKREAEERRRREEEERRRLEDERRRREDEERVKREAAERARREEERRRAEEEDERRRKEEDRRRWEIEAKAEAAELEAQIKAERAAREARAGAAPAPRSDPLPEAAELEAALRAERAETEERVRRENEERVRREEEERRAQEEQARLRPASDAEDEIGRREEEMRRREKEEAERAKQEAKARAEADAQAAAQARKDERERERAFQQEERHAREAERARKRSARAGRGYRRPRNLGRSLAVGLFLILAMSVAVMHFVPIDQTPYEKAAQDWLGQPVRIGAVYVQLVPAPHLRFEKVVIGKDPQMRIPAARAEFAITALFDERKTLRRVELEGGTVPHPFLAALLSGTGAPGKSPGTQRLIAKGVKLDIPGFALPELNVDAQLDPRGTIASAALSGADGKMSGTLQPEGGRWVLEFSADKFTLPIGGNITLDDFSAKGTIGRNEIAFTHLEGRALNGAVQANGRLRWGDGWALDGEFSVRQIDAAKIAAPMVAGGVLEGKGTYGMKAAAPDKLLEAMRMEGNFTIQKGSITNVDMMRILQGSVSAGGTTLFSEMSGSATADAGRIQVRQLRMAAGLLQGAGSLDVDSEKNLSGRLQVELRAQTAQARATVAVSGNVKNPQFRRVN